MPYDTDDPARACVLRMLEAMRAAGGSDLFVAADFPPAMKVDGSLQPMTGDALTAEQTRKLAASLMSPRQREEFERELECNFALATSGGARFRVNVFVQQGNVGMVCRTIPAEIPTVTGLGLPPSIESIAQHRRGLVLVVGGTGSGKSTTLAAMLDHRNRTTAGHIVTIEDPVEFVHRSRRCLVTHREVGVDTHSWDHALRNALRQAPDVILIGEIRDEATMQHAIAFAETGHLCLGTLHANGASQALDRIVNFFPDERRGQLLADLAGNLRAVVSQRLVARAGGKGRKAAVEILINTPTAADRIRTGEFHELRAIMDKSREIGMRTFDWALFELYEEGHVDYREAIAHADSANELRLAIKLRSKRGEPPSDSGLELALDEIEEVVTEREIWESRQREVEGERERERERAARGEESRYARRQQQIDQQRRKDKQELEALREARFVVVGREAK